VDDCIRFVDWMRGFDVWIGYADWMTGSSSSICVYIMHYTFTHRYGCTVLQCVAVSSNVLHIHICIHKCIYIVP